MEKISLKAWAAFKWLVFMIYVSTSSYILIYRALDLFISIYAEKN